MKTDGEHTAKSEVAVYEAHKGTSSARLVEHTFSSAILVLADAGNEWKVKLDHHDLIVLAAVMRRWDAEQPKEKAEKEKG